MAIEPRTTTVGPEGVTARLRAYRAEDGRLVEVDIPDAQDLLCRDGAIETAYHWTDSHGSWRLTWEAASEGRGFRFAAELQMVEGEPAGVVVALSFAVPGSPDDYYSLFPGVVYAHNRPDCVFHGQYPPRLSQSVPLEPDGPRWIGDIPRFSSESGWDLALQCTDLTGSLAALRRNADGRGVWMCADVDETLEAIPGLVLRGEEDSVEFALHFPLIRKRRFRHVSRWEPSPDRPRVISAGQSVTASGWFGFSETDSIPQFVRQISRLRPSLHPFSGPDDIHPWAENVNLIEDKLNNHDWREHLGYYAVASHIDMLQTGWVSGTILVYALLKMGGELSRARALRMLDFIVNTGVSPCGLLYGIFDEGRWRGVGSREGLDFAGRFVRRIGDALYYLIRILEEQLVEDDALRRSCESAAAGALEAFSRLAHRHGHFGHLVDFRAGDIVWGGSAAGAIVIACLARGSEQFARPEWLADAESAAPYYEQFISRGSSFGGPGDILMADDSESAYALVQAFWQLYQSTRTRSYLDSACRAADLFSTWVYQDSYQLPPESSHGRMGIRPVGLITANAQNKALTPGICTASGVELVRLYEETGDEYYLDLIRMIKRAIPQAMCRYEGHVVGVPVGDIPEDVNMADSLCDRGEYYPSCGHWPALAALLSYIELPDVVGGVR